MIAGLLSRLVPYVLPIVLGGLAVSGGVATWWVGWINWPTLGLGVLVLGLLFALTETNNRIYRFAIVVLLAAIVYVKGRLDEHDNVNQEYEDKLTSLAEKHDKAIAKIRNDFRVAYDAEQHRQKAALKAAADAAEDIKKTRTEEVLSLRSELQNIRKEAENAANAKRPALDTDVVRMLNRLRTLRGGK